MNTSAILTSLVAAQFCMACTVPIDQSHDESAKKLQATVTALQSRVDSLQSRIVDLEKSVGTLRSDTFVLRYQYQTAMLNTSEKGYSRLDTNEGTFLISLSNVEPYADGYRLKLDIGNPSTATFTGFIIHASWGKTYGEYEKDFNYTEKLFPGSWNKVYLTLTPAQKEDLANIQISLSTNTVFLNLR